MKKFLFFLVLFCVITQPASAALTQADLENIGLIVEDKIKPLKADIETMKADIETMKVDIETMQTDIVSLKIDVAWMRGRFEGIRHQITHVTNLTYGLIALIVAAIAIPQIIMVWRSGKDREQQRMIQELREEIETLKQ